MKINAVIAVATLAFTPSTFGHMVLSNPVPFAGGNQDPLAESGADFPCGKDKASGYPVGKMNHWKAGSIQHVSFLGTAVHSGGSCQFAFSTDPHPSTNSNWKVIHSVIGGCPMNMPDGVSANADTFLGLPASATWPVPNKFPVKIPKDTPNGRLTFAWIWFNKTGNRETYMKCAPVTISGGSSNAKAFNSRPEIFKANIGNGCHTTEDSNINFPHPGKSSEKRGTVKGNGFTGSCGGSGAHPKAHPKANPKAHPKANPKAHPKAHPKAAGGGKCGADGTIVCFGATKFGICAHGSAVAQPVAAGTKCSKGAIVRRSIQPVRRHAYRFGT